MRTLQCNMHTYRMCAFRELHTGLPGELSEAVGREVDVVVLARELEESAVVLGDSFGGFTFSGGDPLALPEFMTVLSIF